MNSKSISTSEFKVSLENSFRPRPHDSSAQFFQEERILFPKQKGDRRIKKNPDDNNYPCIGHMIMKFGDDVYVGTGTIFYTNDNSKTGYILTCAHNLVTVDVTDNKNFIWASRIWISFKRENAEKSHQTWCAFSINKMYVHPKYLRYPNGYSGYDIGICEFDYKSKWYADGIMQLNREHSALYVNTHSLFFTEIQPDVIDYFEVVGFPAEKRGELWGMRAPKSGGQVSGIQILEKVISYKSIDTTPGQSGSPMLISVGDYGKLTEKCIIGVHTGGSQPFNKNYGTRITKEMIQWIASTLQLRIYSQNLENDKRIVMCSFKPFTNKQ